MTNIFSSSGNLDYPQYFPETSIDFINNRSIPPEYTFTRNSAGTYVGADGYIKTASVNEPRFDYDPVTGESLGLLIEESRTNISNYSVFSFSGSTGYPTGWGTFNPGRVVKSVASFLDLTDSAIVGKQFNNSGGFRKSTNISLSTFTTYTVSWYARKPTDSELSLFLRFYPTHITNREPYVKGSYMKYDDTVGGLGSSNRFTLTDDWTRFSYTFNSGGATSFNPNFTTVAVDNSYASNDLFVISGVQVEVGSSPTSYIPTSGSAVTRQPDQLILNKPFNSLGTFFVESTPTTGTTLSADNGTSSLAMSSTGKEALYYNTNRTLRMSSDSIPTSFNTTPPQDLNRVSLGFNRLNNSRYINGYLKKFMYYGSPVTEDNLRSLTGNTLDTYRSDETIVTDGLVLHLDAGNPASYPGTGTTWSDLSGQGNNGTLVNGVGYNSANGGSLVFDGVDDYVTLDQNIYLNYNKTFIFWLIYSGATTGVHLLNINVSNYRNRVNISPTDIGIYNSESSNVILFNFSEDITNKIKQIGFIVNDSNISLIENGVITQTTTITFPNGQRIYKHLGLRSSGSSIDFFNGKIYNFSHYDRALTPQEVQQNFNALRGRFGI